MKSRIIASVFLVLGFFLGTYSGPRTAHAQSSQAQLELGSEVPPPDPNLLNKSNQENVCQILRETCGR